VELPISSAVQQVLHEELTPAEGLKLLLSREQKPEYPVGLLAERSCSIDPPRSCRCS
jgi:glycerol-3-phosphate dehydrogenase (NAD(P)+)